MLFTSATGWPKRASAAGCTTLVTHSSSAAVIGQPSVCVDTSATVPPASALTLSGMVRPQMPGPSISRAGCT